MVASVVVVVVRVAVAEGVVVMVAVATAAMAAEARLEVATEEDSTRKIMGFAQKRNWCHLQSHHPRLG